MFRASVSSHRAIRTLLSSENVVILVVSPNFAHIGHNGLSSRADSQIANPAPFFKRVFVSVTGHTNAAFLLLKADFISGFDPQGSANLHRNSDLPLAGDLGAENLRRDGFCRGGHGGQLLTFFSILLSSLQGNVSAARAIT